MSDHGMFLIARASVLLLVSGAGVLLLTHWRPLRNPRWHRLAWGMVLVQRSDAVSVDLGSAMAGLADTDGGRPAAGCVVCATGFSPGCSGHCCCGTFRRERIRSERRGNTGNE